MFEISVENLSELNENLMQWNLGTNLFRSELIYLGKIDLYLTRNNHNIFLDHSWAGTSMSVVLAKIKMFVIMI